MDLHRTREHVVECCPDPSAPPPGEAGLTSVLRFPLLSAATETEWVKAFPGATALPGRLDTESWEPERLRSRGSPGARLEADGGLQLLRCIISQEP